MAFFRRSTETKTAVEQQQDEIMEFPFEVLWQDEQQGGFLQYVPHIIEILILLYIAFSVHGLKWF